MNRRVTWMRSIVSVVIVTFLVAAYAFAAPRGPSIETLSLLHEAQRLDPRSGSTDPFKLTAKVTVHRDHHSVEDGSYQLFWFSPTRWREEISSVGFQQVRIGGDGGIWQVREPNYPTLRMWQLMQAVNFYARLSLWPDESPSKVKSTKRDGIELRCISTTWKGSPLRELCFSENSPELMREEYLPAGRSYEFSDYSSAGSGRIPKRIRIFDGKNLVVELSVDTLETVQGPASVLLQKPADAKWLNWCPNPNPAEAIPPFPAWGIIADSVVLSVVVYSSIETDGRLHDLKILKSGGAARDATVLERMSEERFRPATCNGIPVAVETVAHQ
ncbi:MAG: hypothetical protein WBM04_19420 [Candidatus Korobacteraceae bacterium]